MRTPFECALRVGQRVMHQPFQGHRVTGVVYGMHVDHERGLMVDCKLDEPIVIQGDEHSELIKIWTQYAPAHEFSALDDRDELIAELSKALLTAHSHLEMSRMAVSHAADAALINAALPKASRSAA